MTKSKTKKSTVKAKAKGIVASKKKSVNSTTRVSKTSGYAKISKGVYLQNGKYAVRKVVNGTKVYALFTSKTKAKTYYKSL